jgi:hypothetical protein
MEQRLHSIDHVGTLDGTLDGIAWEWHLEGNER